MIKLKSIEYFTIFDMNFTIIGNWRRTCWKFVSFWGLRSLTTGPTIGALPLDHADGKTPRTSNELIFLRSPLCAVLLLP